MPLPEPEYIGDGIYASCPPSGFPVLCLTTGHHDPDLAENAIFFEERELEALENYIARAREARAKMAEGGS